MSVVIEPETDSQVLYHKWVEQGFQPPYTFVAMIEMPSPSLARHNLSAYQSLIAEAQAQARQLGVQLCTCQVCGVGLLLNFVLQDNTARRFVVGCDCVRKLDDTELTTAVAIAERQHRRDLRRAADARRIQGLVAEAAIKERAERDLNGGKTLAELEQERRNQLVRQTAIDNEPFLTPLCAAHPGDFVRSMIYDLTHGVKAVDCTRGQKSVLASIYAKYTSNKSRGRLYDAACAEAWLILDPEEPPQ
jgi:hypothetical protein